MDGKTAKVDMKLARNLTNGRPRHDEWYLSLKKEQVKQRVNGDKPLPNLVLNSPNSNKR